MSNQLCFAAYVIRTSLGGGSDLFCSAPVLLGSSCFIANANNLSTTTDGVTYGMASMYYYVCMSR